MARSRLVAALAVCAALALPAGALADSAGDNQYSDPFGNTPPQQTTTPSQTAPAPAPAPSSTVQSQAAGSPSSQTPNADPSGQLPRTGLDLRLVGGIGLLLLGSGVLLLRRLAKP
jgi:hypothetical protein